MKQNNYKHYPRLEAEIWRKGIRIDAIARILGISNVTLWHKRYDRTREFTISQAITIWRTWFSEVPIETLFQQEQDKEELET